ncbi:MAG: YbaB/EbfC family nucleoid-associated protein [Bacteroidia bacterium]|nr:YbaB/EbfC family nucleoid-associated protein [Bacteroidia bacterium]MDW8345599.1 YbaB/EbfC family nucleoid-associated protein [Bacteroidia bacterium]
MNMNMMEMLAKIQEMQAEIQKTQESLEKLTVETESGGGMVKATANGLKKIVKLQIDKDIIDKEDPEMMEDLIIAAINKALDAADELHKREMQKATTAMLPNIPGLDLSKFGI